VGAPCSDWEAELPSGTRAAPGAALASLPLPAASGACSTSHPAFGRRRSASHWRMRAGSSLTRAARACLDGEFDGVVTGPVHKAAINDGGIAFTGTTGLLAAQAGCDVVMMLANPGMRVALQTVHLPLRAVADASPNAWRTLRILHARWPWLQHRHPTIAVLGSTRMPARGHRGARSWTSAHAGTSAQRGLHGSVRCRRTPRSCPTGSRLTRCWRCTTTRACRC
jgi:hypothetical protein